MNLFVEVLEYVPVMLCTSYIAILNKCFILENHKYAAWKSIKKSLHHVFEYCVTVLFVLWSVFVSFFVFRLMWRWFLESVRSVAWKPWSFSCTCKHSLVMWTCEELCHLFSGERCELCTHAKPKMIPSCRLNRTRLSPMVSHVIGYGILCLMRWLK